MKSYTDIEQSKILSKVLPLNSADNVMVSFGDRDGVKTVVMPFETLDAIKTPFSDVKVVIPCWTLTALISVLPFHLIINNQRYAFSMHKGLNKDGETYMIRYNVFNTNVCIYSTDYYNSPIDACVEMIIKLKENKLI